MLEVSLVADLLIAMLEGIKSKKQIKKYYDSYESTFAADTDRLEQRFDSVIAMIEETFPEGLAETEFRRPHLFYSLFTTIAHQQFGVPNLAAKFTHTYVRDAVRNRLERIEELFTEDVSVMSKEERQFLDDCRRATTDEKVRVRRTEFLLALAS